jgi:hypothetical protein
MKFDDTAVELSLDAPLVEGDEEWMARVMESEPDLLQGFDPTSTAYLVDTLWSDEH